MTPWIRLRVLLPSLLLIIVCVVMCIDLYNAEAIRSYDVQQRGLFAAAGSLSASSLARLLRLRPKTSSPSPRFAITSSVFTADYTGYGLLLGHSIRKHNDLAQLDAEMVLLVLEQSDENPDGITPENRTRLERVGWKLHPVHQLRFSGVDTAAIRPRHRHNLNKLHLWRWTQYSRILFLDADTVVKGDISPLLRVPGAFAAAPDAWWDVPVDTRFNSGVMAFAPSRATFADMARKVADPDFHRPEDADQAFLQEYWKHRFWGLPPAYNLNLIMFQHHPETWRLLWDEAVVVHFTVRKAVADAEGHCRRGACEEWIPLEWYAEQYRDMLKEMGWTDKLPVLG